MRNPGEKRQIRAFLFDDHTTVQDRNIRLPSCCLPEISPPEMPYSLLTGKHSFHVVSPFRTEESMNPTCNRRREFERDRAIDARALPKVICSQGTLNSGS